MDYDPLDAGIQLSQEIIESNGESIGNPFKLKPDDPFNQSLLKDLKSSGTMEALDGVTDITYEQAVKHVQVFFQAGEVKKGLVLLDRIIPDGGNYLDRKREIRNIKNADKTMSWTQANHTHSLLNKSIANKKGIIDELKSQAEESHSTFTVQAKEMSSQLKAIVGEAWGGHSGQEDEGKWLGFLNSGEYSAPEGLKGIANMIIPYSSIQTVAAPNLSKADQPRKLQSELYRKRQELSSIPMLRALAYANPLGQKILDADGKSWDFKDIAGMSEELAYRTVKHQRADGGMLHLLGFGVGDVAGSKKLDAAGRAKERVDRAKKLKLYPENVFASQNTVYDKDFLAGKEGKLVLEMAKHWNTQESLLDEAYNEDVLKAMDVENSQLEFLEKLKMGDYVNGLNGQQAKVLQDIQDAAKVVNGNGTIAKDGTFTPKVDFKDDPTKAIAEAAARLEKSKFDALTDPLSHIATFDDGASVDENKVLEGLANETVNNVTVQPINQVLDNVDIESVAGEKPKGVWGSSDGALSKTYDLMKKIKSLETSSHYNNKQSFKNSTESANKLRNELKKNLLSIYNPDTGKFKYKGYDEMFSPTGDTSMSWGKPKQKDTRNVQGGFSGRREIPVADIMSFIQKR